MSSDFTLLLILALLIVNAWAMRRNARLMRALSALEARIAKLEGGAPTPATVDVAAVAEASAIPVTAPEIIVRAPKPSGPSLFARIEKSLASRWFIWIGGALIILAAALIVGAAIDEGWFGPPVQLALVYLLGFVLLAASEFVRRRPEIAGLKPWRSTPAILAIGGFSAMFAATHAGIATLGLIPLPTAFVVFALIALAAILLSLRTGPWLAIFGLGAGYLAPIMVRFEHPSAAALFGYILAMTAASLAALKLRAQHGFVWLVYAAAIIWALAWIDTPRGAGDSGEAAFYAVGLCMLAAVFAWNDARAPISLNTLWRERASHEMLSAAYTLAFAAGLVLLALFQQAYGPLTIGAIVCFCTLAVLAACLREGFSAAALGAGLLGAAMLWTWPGAAGAAAGPHLPADVATLIRSAGALGFVFSAGGWLMMARSLRGGGGAALSALGPIAVVFATHHSASALRLPALWAAAAIALALMDAFALERISKRVGGVDRAPDVSAAFSLGAAAGVLSAAYFGLERTGLWLSFTFAALAPVIVWLDRRFSLPALRIAAAVTALIVVTRLTVGFEPLVYPLARTPLFNELLPGYLGSIAALWGAAYLYRKQGQAPRVAGWLEACALLIGVAGLFWESRHLANGGGVRLTSGAVGEAGGLATALALVALFLAWRFGPKPRRTIFWGETTYIVLAALLALLVNGLLLNPWLGEAPSPAAGWPVLNLLLLGYGVPTAVLAAYAILKRHHGAARRAALAGAAACLLAFLNVTLEVRRAFHGPAMTHGPLTPMEAWSYTAAWIAFAAVLLGLGLLRHRPTLRYASLAVLLVAIIKAFVFDLSALTGVPRALSYFGLGAAIIATALVYQRFVFPRNTAPRS